MIRHLIDFALRQTFLVMSIATLLLIWGIVSFHRLPVEAYPDVADNYVNVITQWPGRAAEEVERQVTVPLELQMNGIPHLTHLRSLSLFGISSVTMVFDDDSNDFENRQQVLERLSLVTLPDNLSPQIGPDYSPVGQIYFYTLQSTDPRYDVMALKTLQDWTVSKELKSVPDVADTDIFGGMTREYQVQVDPNRMIDYGVTIAQVEQALAANNVNAGGSFIERGQQAFNVRAMGLMQNLDDIGATVVKAQNGTPVRVRDIGVVTQGAKIRLGMLGKAIHRLDGKVVDDDDVVEGIVLLRKGAGADATLTALHEKVDFINQHVLPPGVKLVPFLDRSELVHMTTGTVLFNLSSGITFLVGRHSLSVSRELCAAR